MATQQKNRDSRAPSGTSTRNTATDAGRSSSMTRRASDRDYPASRDRDWGPGWALTPLSPWRSWTDQMERFFNTFGLGAAGNRVGDWDLWSPQVETFQRGNELVVRADLPGLSKDDVNVEVRDDSIVIQGERRDEFKDEHEGFYRSERRYGSFYREIPLPDGAIGDDAKATFRDGVLEITMPAPPREAARGRRIEISEGSGAGSERSSEHGAQSTTRARQE